MGIKDRDNYMNLNSIYFSVLEVIYKMSNLLILLSMSTKPES